MRFPRNARIFRGQLDIAPFASILFLLILFVMLNSLLYTPGTLLDLPVSDDLAGTDKPSVAVALDGNGRLYFRNSPVSEDEFKGKLREAIRDSDRPLTLVVQADKGVSYGTLNHLWMLAREQGISQILNATLPRPAPAPLNKAVP